MYYLSLAQNQFYLRVCLATVYAEMGFISGIYIYKKKKNPSFSVPSSKDIFKIKHMKYDSIWNSFLNSINDFKQNSHVMGILCVYL